MEGERGKERRRERRNGVKGKRQEFWCECRQGTKVEKNGKKGKRAGWSCIFSLVCLT